MLRKLALFFCIFLLSVAPLSAQGMKALRPETAEILERIEIARSRDIWSLEREALAFLIEAGASEKFLISLKRDEINGVANSFRRMDLDSGLASQLSHKPYEQLLAMLDELKPNSELRGVKKQIKRGFYQREHLFRRGTDYDESFYSFTKVRNGDMIRLVALIAKHYDNNRNVCDLRNQFPNGGASNESGGIFVLKRNSTGSGPAFKTEFISLPPRPGYGSRGSYFPAWATAYLPIVSSLHTHPPGIVRAEKYSGPSGFVELPKNLPYYSDFTSLVQYNATNPFSIDTVVTLTDNGSYNIDVYFRDVIRKDDGTYANAPTGTVLDLGVYKCHQ